MDFCMLGHQLMISGHVGLPYYIFLRRPQGGQIMYLAAVTVSPSMRAVLRKFLSSMKVVAGNLTVCGAWSWLALGFSALPSLKRKLNPRYLDPYLLNPRYLKPYTS